MVEMSELEIQQIQNTMKQLQGQIATHTQESSQLKQELETAKQQLSQAQQQLQEAQQKIQNLETQAQQSVTTQEQLAQAQQKIEANNTRISELEGQLAEAQKQQQTDNARISDLEGQLAEAQKQQQTDNARISDLEGQLAEAQAKTAKPVGMVIGADAWVRKEGGLPLTRHDSPGLNTRVIDNLAIGTQVTLLEGPHPADGYHWWRVRASDGREGWVAGEELVSHPE